MIIAAHCTQQLLSIWDHPNWPIIIGPQTSIQLNAFLKAQKWLIAL